MSRTTTNVTWFVREAMTKKRTAYSLRVRITTDYDHKLVPGWKRVLARCLAHSLRVQRLVR